MLLLLPLLAALAGAPEALPAAAPAPAKLEEIGRVRALPACTPIVVRANGAISVALSNDSTLAILMTRLRNIDYDSANEIARKHVRDDLTASAKRMHDAAVAGEGDVKKLRELAAASPNPERKAELKAFADALGGAIFRQKRVAFDLDRAVTVQQGRTAAAGLRGEQGVERITSDVTAQRVTFSNPQRMFGEPSSRFNQTLRDIADDFGERAQLIAIDEGTAADHSLGATTGC